jgi:hypothetical protein
LRPTTCSRPKQMNARKDRKVCQIKPMHAMPGLPVNRRATGCRAPSARHSEC